MLRCHSLLWSVASGLMRRRRQLPGFPAAAYATGPAQRQPESLAADPDMPVDMADPYRKPIKKCVLCHQDVPLDYKNARLLSQFVSPYTGRVYGRHITGLCQPMQERVAALIEKSRKFGYMAQEIKETYFLSDPALFRNPAAGPVRAAAAPGKSRARAAAAPASPPAASDGDNDRDNEK